MTMERLPSVGFGESEAVTPAGSRSATSSTNATCPPVRSIRIPNWPDAPGGTVKPEASATMLKSGKPTVVVVVAPAIVVVALGIVVVAPGNVVAVPGDVVGAGSVVGPVGKGWGMTGLAGLVPPTGPLGSVPDEPVPLEPESVEPEPVEPATTLIVNVVVAVRPLLDPARVTRTERKVAFDDAFIVTDTVDNAVGFGVLNVTPLGSDRKPRATVSRKPAVRLMSTVSVVADPRAIVTVSERTPSVKGTLVCAATSVGATSDAASAASRAVAIRGIVRRGRNTGSTSRGSLTLPGRIVQLTTRLCEGFVISAQPLAQAGRIASQVMPVERVLLAEPRGFCAGVEMAIKALAWMVRAFPPPVYCYHEIVHNRVVVDRFAELGVVFVDDIAAVPPGSALMLSAHGSAPDVVRAAQANGGFVVNAVCPLVTKVHHEAKVRAGKGFEIIYIGHDGHDEAVGTLAVAPEAMHLVERPEDVAALQLRGGPVALLAQTTLSHHDWADILAAAVERVPDLWRPGRSDLCFATTNRQNALLAVAPEADAVVVIGSANSSNTVALTKVAISAGARRVLRINAAEELPDDLTGTVALTAGASAPEELVNAVLERLAPTLGVQNVRVTEEDEYFPVPRNLREFVPAFAAAIAFGFAGPPPEKLALSDDRATAASAVLQSLSL